MGCLLTSQVPGAAVRCPTMAVFAQVSKLGEPRAGDDVAVSALTFSPLGNILAVGHANGDIAFWELRRAGWECGKLVKGQHTF